MPSTRDRILVATNELFRRQGYNGTSLSQISAASGATIGSIYHFFPGGKEALAVAVVETTGAVYRELFESIMGDAHNAVEGFGELFDGAAAVLEASDFIDPCPIGGIAREVANTSEPLRRAAQQAFDSWVAAASDHFVANGASTETAHDCAVALVAMLEGSFVLSRTQRSGAPLLAAGRCARELAARALGAAHET